MSTEILTLQAEQDCRTCRLVMGIVYSPLLLMLVTAFVVM